MTNGDELRVFFDTDDIKGMDDWEHHILNGIRSTRLLLVFLSPNYLESEYCHWEFNISLLSLCELFGLTFCALFGIDDEPCGNGRPHIVSGKRSGDLTSDQRASVLKTRHEAVI